MCCLKQVVMLAAIATIPATCLSETGVIDLLSSYRMTAGLTVTQTEFDVYNKGSSNTNGTLSEDFSYFPFAVVGSPYRYFGDTGWGGLMEYSFSGFRLSKQSPGGNSDSLVDLGTSVTGYYVFATPTVFYSFIGKNGHTENNQALTTGLGVGVGYLKANGNIVFTESTQERVDIDVSGLALAVSLFLDYRVGSFETRLSGGLVSHTSGGFDYDAFGFTLKFGYVFGL